MFGKKDKDKKPEKGGSKQRSELPAPSAAERARADAAAVRAPIAARPPGPRLLEGERVPAVLGVAAATLLQTCLGRMPNADRIRAALREEGWKPEPAETARAVGRSLALDSKLIATPLRDLEHAAWRRDHQGVPAVILLSTAQSAVGPMVFCTAFFGDATEAEAVRVVEALTKVKPAVGGLAHDPDGNVLRRIFWKFEGAGGLLAIALSGPEDENRRDHLRALIAFNRAA